MFYGTAIHSKDERHLEVLPSALIGVLPIGTIAFVQPSVHPSDLSAVLQEHGQEWFSPATELVWLRDDEFLIPGFVDTHTHAAQ